jgi:hypothetical protein
MRFMVGVLGLHRLVLLVLEKHFIPLLEKTPLAVGT